MADNIDKFNLYVGQVFGLLYSSHPLKNTIETSELLDDSFKTTHPTGGFEMLIEGANDELIIIGDTIDWLCDNGFISAKFHAVSGKMRTYTNVVLTQKGLALLKVPSSLKEGESLGSALSKYIEEGKEGAKEAVKDKIKGIISTIITKPGLMIQAVKEFAANNNIDQMLQ